MFRRSPFSILAALFALAARPFAQPAIQRTPTQKPNHGTPSGAAAAKRLARKRRNIRAKASKRR